MLRLHLWTWILIQGTFVSTYEVPKPGLSSYHVRLEEKLEKQFILKVNRPKNTRTAGLSEFFKETDPLDGTTLKANEETRVGMGATRRSKAKEIMPNAVHNSLFNSYFKNNPLRNKRSILDGKDNHELDLTQPMEFTFPEADRDTSGTNVKKKQHDGKSSIVPSVSSGNHLTHEDIRYVTKNSNLGQILKWLEAISQGRESEVTAAMMLAKEKLKLANLDNASSLPPTKRAETASGPDSNLGHPGKDNFKHSQDATKDATKDLGDMAVILPINATAKIKTPKPKIISKKLPKKKKSLLQSDRVKSEHLPVLVDNNPDQVDTTKKKRSKKTQLKAKNGKKHKKLNSLRTASQIPGKNGAELLDRTAEALKTQDEEEDFVIDDLEMLD